MMRMMISAPITCIGGIIMAVSMDPGLSWIIVVVIPILVVVITTIAVKGFPLFKLIQKKVDKINLLLRENLIGIRVIRAFNRNESENVRFHEANQDLMEISVKVNRMMAIMHYGAISNFKM